MTDSHTLLSQYARTGSESAFRELVSRYIDLVYSTAFRLVATAALFWLFHLGTASPLPA